MKSFQLARGSPLSALSRVEVAIVAATVLAVFLGSQSLVRGGLPVVLFPALAILVLVGAATCLQSWRVGLVLFLVWLAFEDLPRKYLGNNLVLYFAKDVLLGLVYVSYLFSLRNGPHPNFNAIFWKPILLFLWLGSIQAANA